MSKKKCNRCEETLELSKFSKDSSKRDGVTTRCKNCLSSVRKDKCLNGGFLESNRRRRGKYKEDPSKVKDSNKKYRERNPGVIVRNNNSIRAKEYDKIRRVKPEYRERINTYRRDRRKVDHLYRITSNLRSSIKRSFRLTNCNKISNTRDVLGCTYKEFKGYIESKFEVWMSWDNHGLYNGKQDFGWDIDHIIPVSSADTIEDVLRLNHYENFQPLCSYTNRVIKKDIYKVEQI